MSKDKSPVYGRRKRGNAFRSFLVVLLSSAAIALAGAGVWQLLDPVDYQPPLEPLTSQSQPEPASEPESSASSQPEEESSAPAQDGPEVQEGEWLASEYFDDALFVGDSITEGIKLYDVMSNVTVLADTGVNLNSLYTKDVVELEDGSVVPILEATQYYNPGKIYLMMGINSMLSDEESFRESYAQVVDTLISQHPDAILYIQSILPVTAEYEQSSGAVADNAKIDRYNEILKDLAEEKGVYYLNVAEVFKDENGCLPTEASPHDGIHFSSSWYRKWFDYLRTHGAE